MGGGGFSMEGTSLLDDFVLGLARSREPKVCFLGQATGDDANYIATFHDAFAGKACRPSHLRLFMLPNRDPREHLLAQDVIYVGGGSTANMLAVWRVHGLDGILREAWENGTVLAGVSAGANCWFEASVTDSFGPLRELDDGLGFLPGSFCPHFDGEPDRRPTYLRLVGDGFVPGLACDDSVAAHFVGTDLREAVSSRQGAHAYRVEPAEGRAVETAIEPRYLG
jgi:peptidase E